MSRRLPLALSAVLAIAGCTSGDGALGGGAELHACAVYAEYESLEEPSPEDPDEVTRYVDGFRRVLDRVDLDEPVEVRTGDGGDEEVDVPESVAEDLELLEETMQALRDDLDAADGDAAAVRDVLADLARNDEFAAADQRLASFTRERCAT